jgi:hypothetical protein
MEFHWAGIEGAIKLANGNPAFRPQVERLVDSYFALIDEMTAELERRRMEHRKYNGSKTLPSHSLP